MLFASKPRGTSALLVRQFLGGKGDDRNLLVGLFEGRAFNYCTRLYFSR
jgi:hypothetical protein